MLSLSLFRLMKAQFASFIANTSVFSIFYTHPQQFSSLSRLTVMSHAAILIGLLVDKVALQSFIRK